MIPFRSQIPLGVVARYTAAVTTFYFACLTPYWAAMAVNLYLGLRTALSPCEASGVRVAQS